jgi:hypothetical protein
MPPRPAGSASMVGKHFGRYLGVAVRTQLHADAKANSVVLRRRTYRRQRLGRSVPATGSDNRSPIT